MGSLIIYNLEVNLDSKVLASAHDWVEAFSNEIDSVFVYSTHLGRHELPRNVNLVEIGGGSTFKRLIAIFRLLKSCFKHIRSRKNIFVFHHMSTKSLLVTGPIYRVAGVKQALWYSHSKDSKILRFSSFFANVIFSPVPSSFPFKTDKLKNVNHGIKTRSFIKAFSESKSMRQGILFLGRISPIKNLELAIKEIASLEPSERRLICVGAQESDSSYLLKIGVVARVNDVQLLIRPPVPYELVPSLLCEYEFIINLTPCSVDKVAIEAALCGCFVLSNQPQTLRLTGMDKIFEALKAQSEMTVSEQFDILSKLSEDQKYKFRQVLSARAVELNDLTNTAKNILQVFRRTAK